MSHSTNHYRGCLNEADEIDCKVGGLVQCGFLDGVSIGVIRGNDTLYSNGFGSRNEAEQPFTPETFAQLEYNSLLLLSLYMAKLAELNTVCPDSRLVNFSFIPPNTRGANMSTTVVDLLSQAQSYEWLDTELTYLLDYTAEEVLELLERRIFEVHHNDHLSRNAFRTFSSKNLPVIQGFLNVLENHLGSSVQDLIQAFLAANSIDGFGYGTANFEAELNHSDGLLRKDCSWVQEPNPDNVENFLASRGAYGNLNGMLSILKVILECSDDPVNQLAKRRYFGESNSRLALWDDFASEGDLKIPDFNVLKGGGYRTDLCKINFHFYPGITHNGVRSLSSWDPDTRLGVAVLARGKTAFPEALAMFAHVLYCSGDVCQANDAFDMMYRLMNPYMELNMLGVGCTKPNDNFHLFRSQTLIIPLDGLNMDSGEGTLNLSLVAGELFGQFGNIPDLIPMSPIALDNYCFELIDRSGFKVCGQIQFSYEPELDQVIGLANIGNKRNIQYAPKTEPASGCDLTSIPLPPLTEECDPCHKPCYDPCYDPCKPYCSRCRCSPCCCPGQSSWCNRCRCSPCCCPGQSGCCDSYCDRCCCNPCCCPRQPDCCRVCRQSPCCCRCDKCRCNPCCCRKKPNYRLLEEKTCLCACECTH